MLILTRKVGEALMIGDNISVTVLGVKGNQARIGINAPEDIKVYREEIYKRIQSKDEAENDKVKLPSRRNNNQRGKYVC